MQAPGTPTLDQRLSFGHSHSFSFDGRPLGSPISNPQEPSAFSPHEAPGGFGNFGMPDQECFNGKGRNSFNLIDDVYTPGSPCRSPCDSWECGPQRPSTPGPPPHSPGPHGPHGGCGSHTPQCGGPPCGCGPCGPPCGCGCGYGPRGPPFHCYGPSCGPGCGPNFGPHGGCNGPCNGSCNGSCNGGKGMSGMPMGMCGGYGCAGCGRGCGPGYGPGCCGGPPLSPGYQGCQGPGQGCGPGPHGPGQMGCFGQGSQGSQGSQGGPGPYRPMHSSEQADFMTGPFPGDPFGGPMDLRGHGSCSSSCSGGCGCCGPCGPCGPPSGPPSGPPCGPPCGAPCGAPCGPPCGPPPFHPGAFTGASEESGAFCGGFNDWKGKRKGKGKEKGKDGREKGKDKGKKGKGKDGKDFVPPLVDGKGKGGYQEQLRPVNFWESWTGLDLEKWKAQKDDVWKSLQLTNPLQTLRSVLKQSQIRYWLASMRSELKHAVKLRNDRHIKAPKPEAPPALKANWVVHFPTQLLEEGVPVEHSLSSKLREVQLKLEGLVPTGCYMTIRVNGRETALERKEVQSKCGEVKQAPSRHETTFRLSRPEDFEAKHPSEGAVTRSSAGFEPWICLEGCTLVARTDQQLLVPTIDVVEAHDTSVVLNLGNLSGETFELTVYAPGCALSAASTLVQKGPVRGSESVHRIGPLEASQVYVAWVKVFGGTKFEESKQKGFKTKQAKEKTIWDEKDHIILGVAEDATAKEIVKAWRMKSLQFHPDKVPDEKKEEAEEMMKRLNLAKVNMMKFARSDTPVEENMPSPDDDREGSVVPDDFDVPEYFSGSECGEPYKGPASEPSEEAHEEKVEPPEPDSCDEDAEVNKARSEADAKEGRVRCSLKIEAKQSPLLRVVERGLKDLELEATGLTPGCHVQVMRGEDDDLWTAVTESVVATSSMLRFNVSSLEENTSYRFRLRAEFPVEPLRMQYLRFADVEEEEAEDEEGSDWSGSQAQ